MKTKDECIDRYRDFKKEVGLIPKYREYLKYAGIPKEHLVRLFGENAYSKLQQEAGDEANRLELERTPLEKIMKQYGNLAMEIGRLPSTAVWTHKGMSPTPGGLEKVHGIKWSNFPELFQSWATETRNRDYPEVLKLIEVRQGVTRKQSQKIDEDFEFIINKIRLWSPARRRNSEGEYKIELRKHLENLKFGLNEEFGESNIDLLVNKRYAIEIKKDPSQSEYDRMFGQLARHLQHHYNVIALVIDAPAEDKFINFVALVDQYLNANKNGRVEVIKK
jgi:hypothetical protein